MSGQSNTAAFTFPWERIAMQGGEMPDGLALPDQMAFTALRNIYDAYNKKIISRDMAAAEKKRIRRVWTVARERWEFSDKLTDHRARILRGTEAAKTACRKEPTPENALRLCDVIDGLILEETNDQKTV